jgi:hypothetical protein
LNLQVVLFDHKAGPDQIEQLVLGHQLAGALDQRQEHVESAGTKRRGAAVHQQPALIRLQLKRAKTVGGHGNKGGSGTSDSDCRESTPTAALSERFQNV